jgi:hypothetical protein
VSARFRERTWALIICSRLRSAIRRFPYFSAIASPCSVNLISPVTVSRGSASIASLIGPPPREMDPPRPWNSRSAMSWSSVISASRRWFLYSDQLAARNPFSLLESE